MSKISYASVIECIMYAMLSTRPDVSFALSVPSIVGLIPLYCDNNVAISQAKEPQSHQ